MDELDGFISLEDQILLSGAALEELMRDVISKDKRFRFRAKGFSMSPFIRDGDLITVSPLAGAPLAVGDVVAFINPPADKLTVHRIVTIKPDGLLIRGDNQAALGDGLIPVPNILGRVTLVERGGKIIRLGLGPERRLIALFSRAGILASLTRLTGRGLSIWRTSLIGSWMGRSDA
jgi:hypothetical protein